MYLMESDQEAERLLLKSDESSTRSQLQGTGLKSGMRCLDAGGGAGFVTKIMGDLVGEKGEAVLADQSAERLGSAKELCRDLKNIQYIETPLENLPFEDNNFDYVFCRFVFEYLKDQEKVFAELKRVTKPGGSIVIGDLDYNVLTHYPLDENLEAKLQEICSTLNRMNLWDPYAGRRLYSYFYGHKLQDIRVQVIPHHLFYGKIEDKDVQNLIYKLDQILELQKKQVIQLSFEMKGFRDQFLEFFTQPQRFSYTPLILVSGIKGA